MTELMEELFKIMDKECENNEEWQKNKPLIINIYVGDDDE